MPNITLTFPEINASAQVGDKAYYTDGNVPSGGFNVAPLASTKFLGEITAITNSTVDILVPGQIPLVGGEFISFVKDKRANTSSLVGYYASVKLVNNSTDNAELFSIGSEVSESSK